MIAEDHEHVEQEVTEVAGVERLQPLLILRVKLGATTIGECSRFAGVELSRSPAAVLPPVNEAGELTRRPALLVEVRSLD